MSQEFCTVTVETTERRNQANRTVCFRVDATCAVCGHHIYFLDPFLTNHLGSLEAAEKWALEHSKRHQPETTTF